MTYHITEKLDLAAIQSSYRLTSEIMAQKESKEKELAAILTGQSDKKLVILGPCSADNEEAVLDYAKQLSELQKVVANKLLLVMRIYTAKPRTMGTGYKGLMHQPDPTKPPSLSEGLLATRRLHSTIISRFGLLTADELLYPSYFSLTQDLVSYYAIGARSVENQEHRLVASSLNQPVGMKNPTSGQLSILLHAIYAAKHPHHFISGMSSLKSSGNPLAHAILRGYRDNDGVSHSNYQVDNIQQLLEGYVSLGLSHPSLIIDVNHDNSGKNHNRQATIIAEVLKSLHEQQEIKEAVKGFMLESYLVEGRQDTPEIYGKSLTDPCMGWQETEDVITQLAERI